MAATRNARIVRALLTSLSLASCGGTDGSEENYDYGSGGIVGSGGVVGTGAAAATGGYPTTTGGGFATGGQSTGGVYGSGGFFTGGAPSTGGLASGGSNTGGLSSGGTNSGGASTGGSSSGGASSGGASTGGSSSGGASSGGSGSGGTTSGAKFVGNITTDNNADTAGKKFSTYWDQITPENSGKWGSVQSTPSSAFNWSALDAVYDYAEDNGILFKQHTFVWGSQQPSGTPTEAQVKNWIQSFCARYPKTKLIDVVNEPPPHTTPNYANNIGGGTNGNWAWITNSFKWARQYCPGAILILNDYNNIEWSGDNSHFISIVKTVLANGGPIDAVGAQAHDLDHASVSTATMKNLIQKLHNDTGLPVYITEYDISTTDDAAQLAKYKEHIPYFLDTDWIHGVTIWGWVRGKTWSQAPDSGLISQQGTPRPAMTWLMSQLGRPSP